MRGLPVLDYFPTFRALCVIKIYNIHYTTMHTCSCVRVRQKIELKFPVGSISSNLVFQFHVVFANF